jgi:hypothetical protein
LQAPTDRCVGLNRGWAEHRAAARCSVRSLEWSRLEEDVASVKFYGPHLGIIREGDLAGGHESFQLVSVHRP